MTMDSVGAPQRCARWGWFALLAAIATAIAVPSNAAAHMGSRKHVEVALVETGADIVVAVDAIDASIALGQGVAADTDALLADELLLRSWLTSGLAVRSEGGACEARAGDARIVERDGTPFVALPLSFECPEPVRALILRDDTVFDDDAEHRTLVTILDVDGEARAHVLSAEAREAVLDAPQSMAQAAATFVAEGALHLAIGLDHLLFLLVLLFAAGPIAVQRGFRSTFREVAWVVTAFTVGHSVSLVAAALGWVTLPGRLVESVIALSIVMVAGLNMFRPDAHHGRPWLALAFGVVHGFGFSSVLADVGLPEAHSLVALASFNVGIELAQLVFVAVVLAPLAWLAARASYERLVMQGGSAVIAAVACFWVIERALGI